MIRADNLTKLYNEIPAAEGISFHVKRGETLVLLGTSGCGKTTTLKMINRLIEPDGGEIRIDGVDIRNEKPEIFRKKIGYVLQNTGLFPHYTIAQNIAVVPRLMGWDSGKIKKRTHVLLEKLHLDPGKYLPLYPAQLSGGQQQRVGLARALAAEPPVLLMDEPFGALDPVTRSNIKKDLSGFDEFKDKAIVLVTHDVQEAFQLGDKICLMNKGRIVQQGSPEDLLFRPADSFVSSFFEEQKLLLEFRQITLIALFPWLPENGDSLAGTKQIEAEKSLWEAIELLSAEGGRLNIYDALQNKLRYASYGSLMDAFTAYKKTIS